MKIYVHFIDHHSSFHDLFQIPIRLFRGFPIAFPGRFAGWHRCLCLAPSISAMWGNGGTLGNATTVRCTCLWAFLWSAATPVDVSITSDEFKMNAMHARLSLTVLQSLCSWIWRSGALHARVLQNNETGGLARPRYPNRNGFRQTSVTLSWCIDVYSISQYLIIL